MEVTEGDSGKGDTSLRQWLVMEEVMQEAGRS